MTLADLCSNEEVPFGDLISETLSMSYQCVTFMTCQVITLFQNIRSGLQTLIFWRHPN